jgi:outer membrane receptor for ferrienterochelin and colicins
MTSLLVLVGVRHLNTRMALAKCALYAAFLVASSSTFAEGGDAARELGSLSLSDLMNLELDSVYGASRYVQKAARAPSSVTVITTEEIARSGARTLGDVLNNVRGLFVANDRNYLYLGVRGFQRPNDYNTRVLVLIDGHRMNDNIYDLGAVGRESMVDVDLIDRVEVIRGPSSSLYGSSAFFGVINVMTKSATAADGLEAGVAAGTFDSAKSRVTLGETFDNGAEWVVSATRETSAGKSELYYPEFDQRVSADPRARNDGIAHGLDREEVSSFYSSLRYGAASVSAFWSERGKHVPTASFGTIFNDSRAHTDDYRAYLDAKYTWQLNDSVSLQARGFYDEYVYSGAYPYNFDESGLEPAIDLYRDKTDGRWIGTEWQLTARLPERHTVVVGGEYRNSVRERQNGFYESDPSVYTLNDDRTSHVLGLFAQSETQLRANLSLTAGIRYDRYSSGAGDTVNPRFGLIYNQSAAGTLKALYGEAFRAPNPYEGHYFSEQSNQIPLKPETIRTYEIVYEKEFGAGLRLTVSGYDYRVDGLISQAETAAGELYFANFDGATARGIEIEAHRRFKSGLALNASHSRQNAEDAVSGRQLTSSPHGVTKVDLSFPLRRDTLAAALQLQHQSEALTLGSNRTPDFLTANFTLRKSVSGSGLELSATVYNLFDEQYAYPGAGDHLQDAISQDGRTFLGKLSYKF